MAPVASCQCCLCRAAAPKTIWGNFARLTSIPAARLLAKIMAFVSMDSILLRASAMELGSLAPHVRSLVYRVHHAPLGISSHWEIVCLVLLAPFLWEPLAQIARKELFQTLRPPLPQQPAFLVLLGRIHPAKDPMFALLALETVQRGV